MVRIAARLRRGERAVRGSGLTRPAPAARTRGTAGRPTAPGTAAERWACTDCRRDRLAAARRRCSPASSAWPTPSSTRRARLGRRASATRASCCRRSPSSPTRARIDRRRRTARRRRPRRRPTPRNLFRVHWYNDLAGDRPGRRRARARRAADASLTGVESPIIVVFGDRFPMIARAQGAGRLRLPGAARRHRPVRPDPSPGDLAVDRQLRPRRRRHQPDHGLPGRGHAARRA